MDLIDAALRCREYDGRFSYISPTYTQSKDTAIRSLFIQLRLDRLHSGTPEFKDAAEKYEGGGLPFHLLYAMEASVNWMLEIGPEAIERRVMELADSARSMLRGLGAHVEDTGSQIVIAGLPGMDAPPSRERLREQKVVIAARHGRLRISPHFYNDEEDLKRLESALKNLL